MRGDDRTLQIRQALEQVILSSPGGNQEVLNNVMKTLDKKKVLRYHNEGELGLLSTPGRVLVALMEDPTMTQRALSVYLDLSETMIDKTVKTLISRGLITKTKSNRQNIYQINMNEVKNHPDIQHFQEAIYAIGEKNKKTVREVGDDEIF